MIKIQQKYKISKKVLMIELTLLVITECCSITLLTVAECGSLS